MKKLSLMMAAMMLLSLAAAGQVQESDNWRAEANARIEKHRKEDVSIRLTQNGKPVNGATVRVEMTRHEFFFGSNIFGWGANNTEYNRRFAELLNFATVEFYWAGYEAEKDKPAYDAMRWSGSTQLSVASTASPLRKARKPACSRRKPPRAKM